MTHDNTTEVNSRFELDRRHFMAGAGATALMAGLHPFSVMASAGTAHLRPRLPL